MSVNQPFHPRRARDDLVLASPAIGIWAGVLFGLFLGWIIGAVVLMAGIGIAIGLGCGLAVRRVALKERERLEGEG